MNETKCVPADKFPPEYIHANNSNELYIATSLLLFFCTLLLGLRFWARSLTPAGHGWDDYFLVSSYFFFLGVCILMYVSIPISGIGRHLPVVVCEDPKQLEIWNLIIYVLDWFYVPSNTLSRISVVLLYLRIFTSNAVRRFCWGMIVFLSGNCIAFLISANLQCIPFEYMWDKSIKGGHCFNIPMWWKVSNVPNIVADIAILLLPLPTIWRLKATRVKKVGIWLVCLTGSVGLVASCARTGEFLVALDDEHPDSTWTSTTLLVWTVVECGMYFCAACLLCLKPLTGRLPRSMKNRWTTIEPPYRSSRIHRTEAPVIKLKKKWTKYGSETEMATDSSSRIVEEDHIMTQDAQASESERAKQLMTWNSITVDTTFEVSSVRKEEQSDDMEYRYSIA